MKRPLGIASPRTHPAWISPTNLDLAWAAGFLEGEGHFRFQSKSQTVCANQVNIEPVSRLLSIFGGRCVLLTNMKAKFGRQPQWHWYINGARARGVMMTLYPFFSDLRKQQILAALV